MKMLHIGLLNDSLQASVEFFDPCLCDATTVISNSCIAGAMGGLMAGRFQGSITATDYAGIANAAAAIAAEVLTENTASGAAIADGDNANIGPVVQSAAYAAVVNGGYTSATAADYLAVAKQIYAVSAQTKAKLA